MATLENSGEYILPDQETQEVQGEEFISSELRPTLMPEDIAQTKAQRVDFALGMNSPGVESLKSDFVNGYEQQTKDMLMNLERVTDERNKQQSIQAFVDKSRSEGRYIDSQDIAEINKINDPLDLEYLLINPDTYFEKRYAREMLNVATQEQYPEGLPKDVKDNAVIRSVEKHLTKQAGVFSIYQELEARYQEQSTLGTVSDVLEQFVPGYSWWNTQNAVEGLPTSPFLQGANIREQLDYFYSIDDPDEALSVLRKAVNKIAEENIFDAYKFVRAAVSYSENEELFDNVVSATDVAALGGARVLRGGANMISTIARAGGNPKTTIPGVLDATGQQARAAFAQVQSRLMRKFQPNQSGASKDAAQDITATVHGLMNPDEVVNDLATTPFSREFANRLTDWLTNSTSALFKGGVLDPINVTRIPPGSNAYNVMMQEAENAFRIQYPEVNDAIIGIRPIRSAENAASNTDHIAVLVGRKTGQLFDADYEAEAIAKLWGIRDYNVVQHGDKFAIEIRKTVDETLPSVRAALATDVANSTPNTFLNRFVGFFRTKDDLVGHDIAQDLKVAALGAEQFSKLTQSIMKAAYDQLPRWRSSSRQDFMRFVTTMRDMPNPGNAAQRGYFPNSIGEFTNQWRQVHNRLPTEQEATAYFTYKRVNDAEWMYRNLNIYKGKSRLGFERWAVELDNMSVNDIEGRLVDFDRVFGFDDSGGIMYLDRQGNHQYFRTKSMTQAERATMQQQVNTQGYRLVQISQYGEEALRATPNLTLPQGKIHYMLVKDYKTRPLSLRQIPYRPGGHVIYNDRFFIGQEHIVASNFRDSTVHDYYGDRVIMSANTPQKARELTDLMEGGRALLNNRQALDNYLRARGAPFSLQEFTRMFDATRGGILNPNIPIRYRPSGSTMLSEHKIDRFYENFRNPFDTPHNAFNEDINLRFAQERDLELHSLENLGTAANPIFGRMPSRLLDPIATISRSANDAARSRYLDDVKIKNAERFMAEFGDLLTMPAEEMHRFPMRAFSEGALNNQHSNKARLAQAKNYQRAMKEFLNIKDPEVARAETLLMNLVDGLRPIVGARTAEPLLDRWTDTWMMHAINDPVKFIRQAAFHPTMGFFNPRQLAVQAQGVVHAAALEGLPRALNGMGAGFLMRPLHMGNGTTHLNYAAQQALRHGYRTEAHFKESYLALQRSGFQNVGGEYGVMDDFLGDRIVQSGGQKFLESGLTFFREGEKFNRLTAWNTAYLRWRADNPLSVFDDQAAKWVLNRADTLTMNMTRASNASWNHGLLSVTSQFWSYHARLMDQMIGGRLTWPERGRVMAYYSALYGVPNGVGGTVAGSFLPVHLLAQKYSTEYGVNMDDKMWQVFHNGVPQVMLGMLTGGEGPNIAQSFGPSGNAFFYDLFRGDSDVVTALGGPGSKRLYDMIGGTVELARQGMLYHLPTLHGVLSTAIDDDTHYLTRDKDIMLAFQQAIKPISALNNAQKAYYQWTTGEVLAKGGEKLMTDANGWQAFFTGILGTSPAEQDRFYGNIDFDKDQDKFQKQAREEATRWLRMSFDNELSLDEMVAYRKRAKVWREIGKFTQQQWATITKDAMYNKQTEIEKMDQRILNSTQEMKDRYFNSIRDGESK